MKAEQVEQAIVELEKAQKQDPSIPHTWFNLGIAFKKERRYEEAVAQFTQMIKLVPGEPVSHYNLGLMYSQLGKEDEALREYARAIQLDPKMVAPRAQTFTIHRLAGRESESDKAREAFLKSKELQKQWDESEDMDWSWYSEIYDPIDLPAQPAPAVKPVFEAEAAGRGPRSEERRRGRNRPEWRGKDRSSGMVGRRRSSSIADGSTATDAGPGLLKGIVALAPGDSDNDGLPDLCLADERMAPGSPTTRRASSKLRLRLPKASSTARSGSTTITITISTWCCSAPSPRCCAMTAKASSRTAPRTFRLSPAMPRRASPCEWCPTARARTCWWPTGTARRCSIATNCARSTKPNRSIAFRPQTTALRAYDVDNDGWLDLLYAAPGGAGVLHNRRREDLRGLGHSAQRIARRCRDRSRESRRGEDRPGRRNGSPPCGAAASARGLVRRRGIRGCDFDGDGRRDLAVSRKRRHSSRFSLNRTKTTNHWLNVALTG